MRFTKMHGAGNDFVVIDATKVEISDKDIPALAQKLCARRVGIGADGLMIAAPATEGGDFRLKFYNSDGTMGEMCGNGARCIARFGYEHGLSGEVGRIETTAGLVIGERISETEYKVRLNDPSIVDLKREAEGLETSYVELGNPGIPHAVVIMDNWDEIAHEELFALGKKLRFSPAYPKGANVNFVKLEGEDTIKAITFERGVEDFTLACGTGSGSIVTALTMKGLVSGENVKVRMPGGELKITLDKTGALPHDVYLTGPTCVVCEGEIIF